MQAPQIGWRLERGGELQLATVKGVL